MEGVCECHEARMKVLRWGLRGAWARACASSLLASLMCHLARLLPGQLGPGHTGRHGAGGCWPSVLYRYGQRTTV